MKFSGCIYALVVYTGVDTKLMQNLGNYKFKRSQMQSRVSHALIFNFFCLAFFVFVSSLWNGLATRDMYESHHYIFGQIELTATEISL